MPRTTRAQRWHELLNRPANNLELQQAADVLVWDSGLHAVYIAPSDCWLHTTPETFAIFAVLVMAAEERL